MKTYSTLREANVARQAEWCPEQIPDLSFRGNELAGETGEVCNVIKKLERERLGWRGSRDTVDHLAEELADVVICADLVAISAGIDLNAAVAAKFNATSEKVDLPHRLIAAAPALAAENERLRSVMAEIVGMSRALRQGGPDPMDLEGLSDALSSAVDLASDALAALQATPTSATMMPGDRA